MYSRHADGNQGVTQIHRVTTTLYMPPLYDDLRKPSRFCLRGEYIETDSDESHGLTDDRSKALHPTNKKI
jgi:hypothetical protein